MSLMEKIRFIKNRGLQIYREYIILFNTELSLHNTFKSNYMDGYIIYLNWGFSDFL